MAENSDNQLIDWLADRCGISQLRACELSTKIRKEHGIDGIISLKEMVLSVPNALSVLGLPIFVQKTLESKLSQSENKLLDSLTPQEVYNALRNLFPANKLVASSFLSSKISGYVLETAETAKQLRLWGVDSADDADELLRQLNLWRVNGVPPAFFCFHKDTSTYPHHLDTTPVQPVTLISAEPNACVTVTSLISLPHTDDFSQQLMASDDNSPADHLTLHKKKRGRPPKAKTAEADGIHAKRSAEDHTQQQKQQKLTTPTLTPAQPGGSVQPHLQPKSKPQPQPQLQPQLQRESQSKRRIMAPLSSAVRDPARPSSRRKRPRIQNDEEEQDGDLNGGDGSDGNDDDNGGGGGSLNGGHHNEEDQEGAGERAHTPREMVDAEVDISALCTLRKKFNAGAYYFTDLFITCTQMYIYSLNCAILLGLFARLL